MNNYSYQTDVKYVSELLQNTSGMSLSTNAVPLADRCFKLASTITSRQSLHTRPIEVL